MADFCMQPPNVSIIATLLLDNLFAATIFFTQGQANAKAKHY